MGLTHLTTPLHTEIVRRRSLLACNNSLFPNLSERNAYFTSSNQLAVEKTGHAHCLSNNLLLWELCHKMKKKQRLQLPVHVDFKRKLIYTGERDHHGASVSFCCAHE